MFQLENIDFFGKEKIKLVNTETKEYVSILPHLGGNINEVVLAKNGKLYSVIAGGKTQESISPENTNNYKGSKLSPFPNRINNGTYIFEGKTYQLQINKPPHALHGFCWNLPFFRKAQLITTDFAQLILEADFTASKAGYPFAYHIEIEYTLEASGFICSTKVTNTGEQNIPIGDGWHPYFTTGTPIDQLKLQLPPNKQLELQNMIPTGNYAGNNVFSQATLLGNTQLDYCFELENKDGIAETKLIDEAQNICITIWQQAGKQGYNFIQAYTPPDRNLIAIEPMSCAPNAFNNKMDLITLTPNESAEFSFGVKVS